MSRDDILANTVPKFSPEAKAKIRQTRKYAADMLVMMLAPALMAWYYYGERALRLIVFSVLTAVATEYIGSKIFRSNATLSDLTAVMTGAAIALCLPASSPLWLPCLASFFAIFAVKLPFGNARSQLFCPAAAGLSFITICMPEKVFAYPAILGAGNTTALRPDSFFEGSSLAYMLSQKNSIGINVISYIDVLVGNIAGPMGATCALAMAGALVYLLLRRPKSFTAAGSFLLVCFAYALLFPRVLTGRGISVFMELCGGLLLFSAVFFLSDEALLPPRTYSRMAYGASAGLICMLMRTFGVYEESVVFAVLIANGLVTAFDKLPLSRGEKARLAKEKRLMLEAEEKRREAERIEKLVGGDIPDLSDDAPDAPQGGNSNV